MRTVLPQYQNHTKNFTKKENHKAILYEYTSKTAQHNTSKLKPAIYKKYYTTQPSRDYLKNARMI